MVMDNLDAAPRNVNRVATGGVTPPGEGNSPANEPLAPEISLLVDGELDAERIDAVCIGLRQTHCAATWVCYHVIGESLRGSCATTPGFSARFAERLAAEPTVLAPSRRRPAPAAMALAVAATVAAVSVVGWVALSTMPMPDTAMMAARQAALVRAADARRAVDNEYLLAHQEYSPSTGIQGARPYLRAVAASEPDARQ
jgi:sigma-E factor negative regulatory protein RseA